METPIVFAPPPVVPEVLGLLQPTARTAATVNAARMAFFISYGASLHACFAACLQERFFQISDDVARVFDAAGEPQRALTDAERLSLLL